MVVIKPNTIDNWMKDFNNYINELIYTLIDHERNENYESAAEYRDAILKALSEASKTINLHTDESIEIIKKELLEDYNNLINEYRDENN